MPRNNNTAENSFIRRHCGLSDKQAPSDRVSGAQRRFILFRRRSIFKGMEITHSLHPAGHTPARDVCAPVNTHLMEYNHVK
jgi:hypothetical protein